MTQHTAQIDGRLIAWRHADGDGSPVLWIHGVPDSGEMWTPFLERAGGFAPDLPGFGESAKTADGPYSIEGYADVLDAFTAHVGLDRVRLVCHDWGAVALAWALRAPERVERVVAIDLVPLLPGYRWHRIARLWRTPAIGELTMGFTTRRAIARATGLPPESIDAIMRHFDHGTQRAILKLYRGAPPERLAAAGERLAELGAPALVLHGAADPYIPPKFGHALADALPRGQFERVPDAGHWPWLDRPDTIDRTVRFLEGIRPPTV